ncbi:Glycosyl hydrolase-like 10 [Psychrobacillus psychrotolerans]|uniref:Glycosyl hydrolase-like 10 n=1 Tax=Psychrobacillus psychrotolerans TaxID=126156 RepID=A0A1I5Y179_9BACI|nr:alpha amylase family protein [Psychrobacillus psychrotolerans]SFQ37737.1 Glycosyl hydrolase-like 10 [Psychrobacillus psychrotolerans]
MDQSNILWVDFLANGTRLLEPEKMKELIHKALKSKITHLVIDAKIPYGFTTFPSEFAYHVSEMKDKQYHAWKGRDFLQEMIHYAKGSGLKIIANVDIFAEGNGLEKEGMVYDRPEWQVVHYNEALSNTPTAAENRHDPTVFVNPIHPEVEAYELNIIQEIVRTYDIDGVVLDRCRYPNIYGDFSNLSREKFEAYIGQELNNWPEDIMTVEERNPTFGPLFPKWAEFRAKNIKNFVQKAKSVVKTKNSDLIFSIYVGSWYPLYYNEGVNWGSETYHPSLEWASDNYHTSGYAEEFDFIMTGCYYKDVTIEEAESNGRPASWYSVEGAMNMSKEAINGKVPVIGSLYLKDYTNNVDQFKKAVQLCKERSNGVMLFDTVYLEEYKWWNDLDL